MQYPSRLAHLALGLTALPVCVFVRPQELVDVK